MRACGAVFGQGVSMIPAGKFPSVFLFSGGRFRRTGVRTPFPCRNQKCSKPCQSSGSGRPSRSQTRPGRAVMRPSAEAGEVVGGQAVGGGRIGGEEQLVVLASAGGGAQVGPRGDGDERKLHLRTRRRTVEDVSEVRSQSVREVHHGVHLASGAQPCTLPDLRLRVAVHGGERRVVPSGENVPQSGARGPQFARDEDDVALRGV